MAFPFGDLVTGSLAGFEPAIRCPVLLLQADPAAGGLIPDAELERALALLGQARHVRFEQRGHVLFIPDPEPVVRAVIEFFESL